MTTISTTEDTHDLYLKDGDIAISSGTEANGEVLKAAILTCLGEIQLDQNLGVPYFETIFRSVGNEDIWQMYFNRIVTGFDFVESIDSFDVNIDSQNKHLSYSAVITTGDGQVTIGA